MSDPLTDLISDIQHNGIRWVSVITIITLYRKERRTHLLNKRDTALFHNQKIIMEALGRGDQWKDGPKHGLQSSDLPNLKHLLVLLWKATLNKKSISRRKNMLTNLLKANLSKKLISALVAIGVTALNQKFGLHLTENDTTLILGLSLAHISLQTIIDAIKAWALSKAPIIVHEVVPAIQNLALKAILDPNATYQDLFPKVKVVHEGLTKIYADIQKNDGSQAFRDASQIYLELHDIFQSLKPPVSVPEVVEQVSA